MKKDSKNEIVITAENSEELLKFLLNLKIDGVIFRKESVPYELDIGIVESVPRQSQMIYNSIGFDQALNIDPVMYRVAVEFLTSSPAVEIARTIFKEKLSEFLNKDKNNKINGKQINVSASSGNPINIIGDNNIIIIKQESGK